MHPNHTGVVVVDADPAVLRSCEEALARAGWWDLRLYTDPRAVLAEVDLSEVDLLICDVTLSADIGGHLLNLIENAISGPALVLAMMSAEFGPRHEVIGRADDFLLKPIDSTELMWRIERLLEGPRRASASFDSENDLTIEIHDGSDALQAVRERLENVVEAKDAFIASVGHELRTPLTAVLGFAAELASDVERLSRRDVRDAAQLIAEQATKLSAIIDDMLVAARHDIDTVTLLHQRVDLSREL